MGKEIVKKEVKALLSGKKADISIVEGGKVTVRSQSQDNNNQEAQRKIYKFPRSIVA